MVTEVKSFYRRFIHPNLANAISILGVLPLAILFFENDYLYLIPLIIYNNIMDDLDGLVATKLNIRSQFGANLDNVCDAVAHTILLMVVSVHFGGLVLLAGMIASTSIILRATSRLNLKAVTGVGSPTNELMRHLLFVLILMQYFDVNHGYYLLLIFILHSITMIVPIKLVFLIRGLAKTATAVLLVNISLLTVWLVPVLAPLIALAFFSTYLYSFIIGTWHGLMKKN